MTSGESDIALDCQRSILREIHEAARRSRRKAYFCGVLFGRRAGAIVRIQAWRGDSKGGWGRGLLENVEGEGGRIERLLGESRGDESLAGLAAVGWFVARREGDLAPQHAEIEVYNRFFPEPWQVTLLIRPGAGQGAARFFGRGTSTGDSAVLHDEEPAPVIERGRPVLSSIAWAFAIAGWVLLTSLAVLSWRWPDLAIRLIPASPGIALRLETQGGGLIVEWDHAAAQALGVRRATIEFRTGSEPQDYDLDVAEVASGMFRYQGPDADVNIEMTFYPASGGPIQSYARLIHAAPAGPLCPDLPAGR